MERRGVERGGAEANPLRDARDREEREDRRLEEEIVEDGDDVEPGGLGAAPEPLVLRDGRVGLEAKAELEPGQVRSSVRSTRSPMRSMRMTTRSSGSGQQTRLSRS